MHAHKLRTRGLSLAIPGVLAIVAALGTPPVHGDDNGILGRLFRLGGSSSNSARSKPYPTNSSLPYGGGAGGSRAVRGSGDAFIPPANPRAPAATPTTGPIGAGPSTPEITESGAGLPPLSPRPRVSSAATTAEPLLSRVALGRSNDGSQFGMFLQIFADGTVIDSEGVHRISSTDLRPIAELVNSGELGRLRGHCGNPSSDFIEEVHVIVYEHRLGRLAAVPFSYSGNPQGCDPSVKHLHTLIENLQAKLSRPPSTVATSGPATLAAGGRQPRAGDDRRGHPADPDHPPRLALRRTITVSEGEAHPPLRSPRRDRTGRARWESLQWRIILDKSGAHSVETPVRKEGSRRGQSTER